MWKTNGTIIHASLSTLFLTLDRLSKYKIINSADFIIFLDRVDTTEVYAEVSIQQLSTTLISKVHKENSFRLTRWWLQHSQSQDIKIVSGVFYNEMDKIRNNRMKKMNMHIFVSIK